ncbi:Ig-like domain repeat protein [Myxococcus landrumensis]|uniref:Ig-like domain repeat protein n=1 Tax=Myxococcus landrumensis TaxID=2813577 RepID=A0ABX7NB35_9BACT|nr:Ig-like domain repeat protein [Myxococcus landrumus]QSQ15609.1 Ig-like domain repeat protein [Myxococcus landrumus]
MRRWSPSFLVVVLSLLGVRPAFAQAVNPESLILSRGRDVQGLIVQGTPAEGLGLSHTLGWFYYDALVERGYVDLGNPDDPTDDVLRDGDGNGVPDFHEDLYNLNPARGYIGLGPRCSPERLFTHQRAAGGNLVLREPDLLTGSCSSAPSYAANAGPRRWPTGEPGYPARPGGSVVGQPISSATDLVTPEGYLVDSSIPDQVDAYFGDRGVFPHIPNLLEPQDPLNLGMGFGQILMLSTDDDGSRCPEDSYAAECLAPRMAQAGAGELPLMGPVWDREGTGDGIPDYKTSAFDPWGRIIPGQDPHAPINESDRRVEMGHVDGQREIVFFLVTYSDQRHGPATDTCFLPAPVGGGRLQCELWGHGDINVFFSKTLLNLDLYQLPGNVVASVNPSQTWLQDGAYMRLGMLEMGQVSITETDPLEAVSLGQKTPHMLILNPNSSTDSWVMGWEDLNSGGTRSFNNTVFILHGVGVRPTNSYIERTEPNPAAEWQPVLVEGSVQDRQGDGSIPTGTMEFLVDGVVTTTVALDATGRATTELSFAVGEYAISARYVPDNNVHGGSESSAVTQSIEPQVDGGEDAGPVDGGEDAGEVDAGPVDSGSDAGEVDAGEVDSGSDAGEVDAGEPDAGEPDAGEPDAGPDAGDPDAGSDAGEPDAGEPDAGADAGEPDAGEPDAGSDAGEPDAGEPDSGAADSGSDAGEVDAGSDAGEADAGDTDAGSDAGTADAGNGDAGAPTEEDGGTDPGEGVTGPRDLKVTGWGCSSTDAGGSSLMLLSLWLGLSLMRSRRRAHS